MFKEMFTKDQTPTPTVKVVVAPPVPVPVGIPAVSELEGEHYDQYVAVATKIGFSTNPAMTNQILRHKCASLGLRIYNSDEVGKYLDDQFKEVPWGWKPLRDVDVNKLESTHKHLNGRIQLNKYQGAVPLPVLLTVEALLEVAPNVHFYVSDRTERDPADEDPFLMVSSAGMNSLIVERWDEPNFIARG